MNEALPVLAMSGIAVEDESDLEELDALDAELESACHNRIFDDTIDDLVDAVKTPPRQKPNMEDPDVFAEEFEKLNSHHKLWFSHHGMFLWNGLVKEINRRLEEPIEEWNGCTDFLFAKIHEIESPLGKKTCLDFFNSYMNYSKSIPAEKAVSYEFMRETLGRWADAVIPVDEIVREEVGFAPNNFEYVTEEMTEEQKEELLAKIE